MQTRKKRTARMVKVGGVLCITCLLIISFIPWAHPSRAADPDADNDGVVDLEDLRLIRANLGKQCGSPEFNPLADVNRDCVVNADDLTIVRRTLRKRTPIANAGRDLHALTAEFVFLDGSASYDPNEGKIALFWVLVEAPPGSTASLADSSRPNPPFVPDVPGAYVFELVVHNGQLESPPTRVTLTAFTEQAPPSNAEPIRLTATRSSRAVRNSLISSVLELNLMPFGSDSNKLLVGLGKPRDYCQLCTKNLLWVSDHKLVLLPERLEQSPDVCLAHHASYPEQSENHPQRKRGDAETTCIRQSSTIDCGVPPPSCLADGNRLEFSSPQGFHVNQALLESCHFLWLWVDGVTRCENDLGKVVAVSRGTRSSLYTSKAIPRFLPAKSRLRSSICPTLAKALARSVSRRTFM